MALDRSSIQRTDFPTSRRGYETTAVDAHLRAIADEVEGLSRAAAQPVAAAASSQVQRIIEVAETASEQLRAEAAEDAERLRSEAGEEAREHVRRASAAVRELLERVSTLQEELGSFLGRLHDDAGRLSAELRALESDVEPAAPTDTTRVDDEEAARLVALDMALGGSPREETEARLSEHYRLSNADKLLDDVYALAGS